VSTLTTRLVDELGAEILTGPAAAAMLDDPADRRAAA
jgi:hypothetical protein